MVIPATATEKIHYEGELVVVIGKKAKHLTEANAMSCVFGYTIGNDVSERSWQKADRGLWRAKNADTFKPMGPWIETEVDLDKLETIVKVNGKETGRFHTNDMIFGIKPFIVELTKYFTLWPGDVIWMGTDGASPDLKAGDVVEIEITGIGTLRNRFVEETHAGGPIDRDDFSSNRHPALSFCLSMIFSRKPVPTFPDHALSPPEAPQAMFRRRARRAENVALFHDLGANLANRGILIAGAAAAAHRADQLAAFDQRKSAGARDQRRIERGDIGVTGFIGIEEHAGFPAEARRGAGLADRDRAGCDLRAFHPLELDQFAIGVDDGDVHLPVAALGFGFGRGHHLLGALEPDRYRHREYRTASRRACHPRTVAPAARRRLGLAKVAELTAARAQAARVIETIERIIVSRLKLVFVG